MLFLISKVLPYIYDASLTRKSEASSKKFNSELYHHLHHRCCKVGSTIGSNACYAEIILRSYGKT